jgi:uncharacterized protein (TIGR02186 family)
MLLLAIALMAFAAAPARTADVAVALTDEIIDVDAGFSGARIVLFGAVTHAGGRRAVNEPVGDLVAVVRGPASNFRMRPMVREQMIWIAGPGIRISGAPGILLTISTRPLEDIASPELRRALQLDADAVNFAPLVEPLGRRSAVIVAERGADALGAAFLGAAKHEGIFKESHSAISFKKGSLFSIDIELPPTTPVGQYGVDLYLIRDDALVSWDRARLSVRKVGIERGVYDIAHQRPIAYGIGCVAISIAAGWLAAAAFRRSS